MICAQAVEHTMLIQSTDTMSYLYRVTLSHSTVSVKLVSLLHSTCVWLKQDFVWHMNIIK